MGDFSRRSGKLSIVSQVLFFAHGLAIDAEDPLEDKTVQHDDVEPAEGQRKVVQSVVQVKVAAQAEKRQLLGSGVGAEGRRSRLRVRQAIQKAARPVSVWPP